VRSRSMGGDHGATGFCKQLVAIDSHRTMPPARQAHVECGLLNVRVVVATSRHAIPAIYFLREFAAVGGRMSYGNSLADAYHRVGISLGS
jgi:hypothetical protein